LFTLNLHLKSQTTGVHFQAIIPPKWRIHVSHSNN
jgi:hypothetical protein